MPYEKGFLFYLYKDFGIKNHDRVTDASNLRHFSGNHQELYKLLRQDCGIVASNSTLDVRPAVRIEADISKPMTEISFGRRAYADGNRQTI
jgi:hypothetical protein